MSSGKSWVGLTGLSFTANLMLLGAKCDSVRGKQLVR